MTVARSDINVPPGFQPRLLSAEVAALYVGLSRNAFTARVGRIFPAPLLIDGKKVWDVQDLDRAIERLKTTGDAHDPWD